MATETYSITNDTLNGVVDVGTLHRQIEDSAISVTLVGLSTDPTGGDNLYIEFESAVSGGNQTLLDALVAAHEGEDLSAFLDGETGWNISVEDRDLTSAPGSPATDLFWIVGSSATGDWSSHDNQIASWNGNNWQFQVPASGFGAWIKDENILLVWDGSEWSQFGDGGSDTSFGGAFHSAQSTATSTTTSSQWQTKVLLNTATLEAGTYLMLVSYGWSSDTTSSDFEAQVRQGETVLGQIHKQEPKDSGGYNGSTGTDQRHLATRHYTLVLSAGSYTFDFRHRTSSSGNESSTWDVYMSFWRVS